MKSHIPPFELGDTYKGTDDAANLINAQLVGLVFEHQVPAEKPNIRGDKARKHGKSIFAMVCRNTSGAALLGKRVGQFEAVAGLPGFSGNVGGYAAAFGQGGICVVDPYLDSTGVADDDLFWGVLKGPVLVLVPDTGAVWNGDYAVGGPLVAATADTTGNSTSGRLANITLSVTAATSAFSMARNLVGYALSAKTTQQTTAGQDVLIDACILK